MGRLFVAVFLVLLVLSASLGFCCARGDGGGGGRGSSEEKGRREERNARADIQPYLHDSGTRKLAAVPLPTSSIFNVLQFGAVGNGISDDTQAFRAAWVAACVKERSIVLVPAGHVFLVAPVSFSGSHCKPNIFFQLDGTIIAPTDAAAWKSSKLQWLKFTKLGSITITGRGTLDGRGAAWWANLAPGSPKQKRPASKPTALRFYGSEGVTVSGITIRNSAQCHLKFDSCAGVEVFDLTVSSPSFSVRTDGIHLQNSRNVSIHHVVLGCGDDCISIQTGCSNVKIHNVSCGPGHGISIGGLGAGNTMACVSNVTIGDVALRGTLTGVRIKTWQGGYGYVKDIRFSNIMVDQVETPMVIDQYYCDGGHGCKNKTAAVTLSGISYDGVKGTFTRSPLHLACSDSAPCTGIRLSNVQLAPAPIPARVDGPFCWQAHGQTTSPVVPPVWCLLSAALLPSPVALGSC